VGPDDCHDEESHETLPQSISPAAALKGNRGKKRISYFETFIIAT
jgi:hypothetical protein